MKKNVIITCSDARYGDFLTDHWLRSLLANVNMTNIDVAVLDYGLTESQRETLETKGVRIVKCEKNGKVVIIRFRDIAAFLRENPYEQVLTCDGGDIIFQADISGLFEEHREEFRAACQDYGVPVDEVAVLKNTIDPRIMEDIRHYYTQEKKMINAGVLIGPREAFIELSDFVYASTLDKNAFGPDQVIINYLFYKRGFHELDLKYNFILYSTVRPFSIRNGVFLDQKGEIIPIVHNAGRLSALRVVRDFGYGPDHNKLKILRFYLIRLVVKLGTLLRNGKKRAGAFARTKSA